MSATSTTYDVRVRYLVDDKAGAGLRNIGKEAGKAAKGVDHLSSGLRRLAMAAGAYMGFTVAYKGLVAYNAQLENTQAQLRTTIMMFQKTNFADAGMRATKMMGLFREDAKKSAGTMSEMADFAANIANSVYQAGGNDAILRDVTRKSVVAAAALFPNMSSEMAQLDVTQAMQGTLTQRDRFSRSLIASQGMDLETFNALDPKERLTTYMKALNDPAILEAAKAYEKSWAGVTSTLKDNLQQIVGKIGLPLFQQISKEIQGWNKWIENNQVAIADFSRKFADGLKEGWGYMKSIAGFIVEHKDLLILLAKAWIAGKVIKGITEQAKIWGDLFGSVGKIAAGATQGGTGAAGIFARLGGAAKDAGSSLAGLGRNFGLVAGVLAATYLGAKFIAKKVDEAQDEGLDEHMEGTATGNILKQGLETGNALLAYKMLKGQGKLDKNGRLILGGGDAGMFRPVSHEEDSSNMNYVYPNFEAGGSKVNEMLARGAVEAADEFISRLKLGWHRFMVPIMIGDKNWGGQNRGVYGPPAPADLDNGKRDVNIGKIVMNIESNDPDNFAIGMEGYFRAWTSNPTSNPKSIREGR